MRGRSGDGRATGNDAQSANPMRKTNCIRPRGDEAASAATKAQARPHVGLPATWPGDAPGHAPQTIPSGLPATSISFCYSLQLLMAALSLTAGLTRCKIAILMGLEEPGAILRGGERTDSWDGTPRTGGPGAAGRGLEEPVKGKRGVLSPMGYRRKADCDLGKLLSRVKEECRREIDDCLEVLVYPKSLTDETMKKRLQPSISEGMAIAYSEVGLKLLRKEFKTEAAIGQELGVSQSAVSLMIGRRSLPTRHLVYVSYRYPSFEAEAQEGAVLGAWSSATEYVRRAIVAPAAAGRPPVCGMDYEECACLAICALDPGWREAREAGNRFTVRERAERIIDQTHGIPWIRDLYATLRRPWRVEAPPDLEQLEQEWRDALLVAAWFIPVKGGPS
jgi:hypothetical protein